MKFTVPTGEEESLVKFDMSNNLFEETELTPDFWVNFDENYSSPEGRVLTTGACLTACDKREKNKGWCKAGCWGELAIKAAAVVIAIVALK